MTADLVGRRVLVVEDESMISMFIEDTLADIGCVVAAVAARLPDALRMIESVDYDVALLDVNLSGTLTFDLAHMLMQRGKPFIFSTGYGKAIVPQEFDGVPVLQKPFMQKDLEVALRAVVPKS